MGYMERPRAGRAAGEAQEWAAARAKGLDLRPEALRERAERLFPVLMYKGVIGPFDEFDLSNSQSATGTSFGEGQTYLTSDPAVAEWFALFPLRSPAALFTTLARMASLSIPVGQTSSFIASFLNEHPALAQTMGDFSEVLRKHELSERTLIGKWVQERKLRNEVLEAAERVASAFSVATGHTLEIRPSVMPLRVDDEGFLDRNGNGQPMEGSFNRDTMMDALEQARSKGKGGVTMHNVTDGSEKPSVVMAVIDTSRLRSTHAVFDPDDKGLSGLMR